MAEPFIAQITLFAGSFAPRGYAFCNGQILSIAQNTALFSLLGTTYGGNGQSTFALPDLRGRVPIHYGGSQGPGLSAYVLGQQGGAEAITLSLQQLPSHSHLASCSNVPGTVPSPEGAVWAEGPSTGGRGGSSPNQYATQGNATMAGSAIGNSGGSQSHSNIQPYLVLNYIIALQGIFPSRN